MARSTLAGSRIRQRRMLIGLSQAELARRLGVSASYLNLIEHNRRRVAPDLLERMAGELEVKITALSEGAEPGLLESLREAAATHADPAAPRPESDRLDEFAGRFPGWAALLSAQQHRLSALERTVERLTDRMTHDPHLSASLHEVLSVAASLRSTAAILAETDDIDPQWRARFHGNLHLDSQRLAEGAQALVGYLEASQDDESGLAAPQEELEAWLVDRDFHVAELEGKRRASPEALVEGQATLASRSARKLAVTWLHRYRRDAEALPLAMLVTAVETHGPDPARLSELPGVGGDLPRLFRRLASLPPGVAALPPIGLVICDGSGTMIFRKPIPGFGLPRFGSACPLWPLFQALSRPLVPIRTLVETVARPPQRFQTFAICQPAVPPTFDEPVVLESLMLIVPATAADIAAREGSGAAPQHPVGISCRICPRADCPARREPSIAAQGF